jgi:ABC-type nitrate/sulfonate/bicarbonate transport system permease component
VIEVLPRVVANDAFWAAAWSSLGAILIGLAIALAIGTIVGLAIGRVRTADRMLDIYVNGFFTMPMIAVLPLLTVWFGYGDTARLATIIFAALFSVIINVSDGARSVPQEYIEVGRAYRARGRDIWFDITLFSAVPYLIAGVRLAAGRALVGTVLAEIFASIDGLGLFILSNARGLRQNEAVVGVLLLALFGLTFEWLMNGTLRRYFPWYRRERQE